MTSWPDDVAVPALLRAARRTYGAAVRSALAEVGCEDLPPNGPFVLGALARADASLSEVIETLGVSKQAAGQLVDVLVQRAYLTRTPDPDDRRRVRVGLTERGLAAAAIVERAVERVDAELVRRVGRDAVGTSRATLAALIELGAHDAGAG